MLIGDLNQFPRPYQRILISSEVIKTSFLIELMLIGDLKQYQIKGFWLITVSESKSKDPDEFQDDEDIISYWIKA